MSRFDDHVRDHCPVRFTFTTPKVHGVVFREASTPGGPLLDLVEVVPLPGGLTRFIVVDPAVSLDPLAALPGAHALISALSVPGELSSLMDAANKRVYLPGSTRLSGPGRFAAALADFDPSTGQVRAAQAGDCEVWVRKSSTWVPLFTQDMLTPSARASWQSLAPPQTDRVAHLRTHDEILGSFQAWQCAPLGSFPDPLIRLAHAEGVDAFAVASDGLLAAPETFDGVDAWLERLHCRGEDWPHPSPHGDIAFAIGAASTLDPSSVFH